MISQYSCHVLDCPICGRPVEVRSQYVGHEIACGHCRGHFVAHEMDEEELIAARPNGMDLLERAEHLLRRAGKPNRPASVDRCERLLELLTVLGDQDCFEGHLEPLLDDGKWEIERQPTALLVEQRDEVFARIATDLAESGMRVIRARSVTEALRLCGTYDPTLVVANLEQSDQSGWLLAGKLRFIDERIRVWLYHSQSTTYDEGMATYLQVDQLLDHSGDLLGLSETIVELISDRQQRDDVSRTNHSDVEPTGA